MRKRYRVGWGSLVTVFLSTLLGHNTALAQDITGFQNGYLTFTNENPSLYYRVEFKPNLTDPVDWDGTFRSLRNIQSPNPEVTVPVGVFYRVAGRDTPWVAGTASTDDILSGKTAYVNDEEVTGTMANVGKTNMTPGNAAQPIPQGYHDGTGSVAGDVDLVAGNIKKDVTIFGVTGTHEGEGGGDTYNAAVPKTGQTATVPINPAPAGSDGNLQKGVAWPNPRFTDHGDTVTDNLTGLMWTKNANLPNGQRNWNDAIAYCNNMNLGAGTYGYTDWRLPNVREQQSLSDYGFLGPALPAGHPFTGLQANYFYWSSSTFVGHTDYAWYVNLNAGNFNTAHKPSTNYLWPVRGGQ